MPRPDRAGLGGDRRRARALRPRPSRAASSRSRRAPVPAPLPRHGETFISVPPVVTGFGSGAPVRRRGRARRLGVFACVAALMLCVLWAALIGLRWSHFVGVDPATARSPSTRASRTTSAAA